VRIAVVSTLDLQDWGGSEELWAAMTRVARAAGHVVCASVNQWGEKPPQIAALERDGVEVHTRSRLRQRALYRASPPLALPINLRMLDRFGPDVVCLSHGATWDVPRDPGLHTAIRRHLADRGVPYVPLCQYGTGYQWLYDDERARALEYYGSAAAVGWVADENRVAAERMLAAPIEQSFLVQNPLTIEPAIAPWPDDATAQLACVARLDAGAKGQDVLLEALATEPWRDRDWHLTLYGAGVDRAWLTSLVRHYGLGGRVELAGHVERVDDVWRRHHVLVLPSRAEGTSLALLEAMATGRPCVATDVGGARDWVVPGETGFLASAPTAVSLARALEALWSARSAWQVMGLQAHEVLVRRRDPDPGATLLAQLERAASTRAS
jgi:glycosyltransferase involved in cell wall biosynthesis